MSETDLSAQVDAICRENERLTERVAALESELAKVRELAAAVVRSHDAPGGCRGQVGWTAMQSLSDHLNGEAA